jgi:hypothetical protein
LEEVHVGKSPKQKVKQFISFSVMLPLCHHSHVKTARHRLCVQTYIQKERVCLTFYLQVFSAHDPSHVATGAPHQNFSPAAAPTRTRLSRPPTSLIQLGFPACVTEQAFDFIHLPF